MIFPARNVHRAAKEDHLAKGDAFLQEAALAWWAEHGEELNATQK